MRGHAPSGMPAAGSAPATASPAAGRPTALRLIAALLIVAAALDLTRCSLVMMTLRHVAPTVGLVAAGIGAAVISMTAARGYRAGQRWAAWTALLIGVASGPQASASGFRNPYTIPDAATAVLGVLLAVAILATAGRTGTPAHSHESPCARHEAPFGRVRLASIATGHEAVTLSSCKLLCPDGSNAPTRSGVAPAARRAGEVDSWLDRAGSDQARRGERPARSSGASRG
jgi:hypothetical protein